MSLPQCVIASAYTPPRSAALRREQMASRVDNIIEQTYRQEAGRILAGLIALVDDFTLAEDALQDAVVNALQSWSAEGVPRNPAGWLTTVARRRAIERLRRDETLLRKQPLLEAEMTYMQAEQGTALDAALAHEAAAESIPDERLKLLFTCCHPALALDARIALTLRTLGGLTTEEIASAFLTSTPTLASLIACRRVAMRYPLEQRRILHALFTSLIASSRR